MREYYQKTQRILRSQIVFDINLEKKATLSKGGLMKAETMEKIRNVYEAYSDCKNKRKDYSMYEDSRKYIGRIKNENMFYRKTVYNSEYRDSLKSD